MCPWIFLRPWCNLIESINIPCDLNGSTCSMCIVWTILKYKSCGWTSTLDVNIKLNATTYCIITIDDIIWLPEAENNKTFHLSSSGYQAGLGIRLFPFIRHRVNCLGVLFMAPEASHSQSTCAQGGSTHRKHPMLKTDVWPEDCCLKPRYNLLTGNGLSMYTYSYDSEVEACHLNWGEHAY